MASVRRVEVGGGVVGSVARISHAEGWLDIKKRQDTADTHATALVMHNRVDARELRNSLMRLAAGDCEKRVMLSGFA